jgi:predicted esterase
VTDSIPAPHAHHIRVQRTARYYTLGGKPGEATRRFWFVLHGYGQLAGDFVRFFGDLAGDDSMVVAPEALNRYYTVNPDVAPARDRPVGATWMTREDRESEVADYVEYLDTVADEVTAGATDPGVQLDVIGFSQGAATAARWVAHGRVPATRLILWGGLVPPDADLSRGPHSLRGVPVTIVLGSRDHYVSDAALADDVARLAKAGIPASVIRFDGGHAVSRSVFPQLTGDAGES